MENIESKRSSKAAGGEARAAALSPERRIEIAKKAAEARWGVIPRATHDGVLRIGEFELPCFVLEDGKRVLSQSGMALALRMSKGGSRSITSGDRIANFAAGNAIRPFVPKGLASITSFQFKTPRGRLANAYEATILADLCEAVIAARRAGALTARQQHIAVRCEVLMAAFARTGIVALVDEATGYQEIRPRDALQQYLEMILRKELAAWSKRFPDEFYENIYKLKGWTWPGMQKNRYSVVAHYTRDLVYERIAPSLLQELEVKNPPNEKHERPNKFHQWLTDDIGIPMLAQHLHTLVAFQRLAIANGQGWKRFLRMVDQVLPKKGSNLEFDLGDTSRDTLPIDTPPRSSGSPRAASPKGKVMFQKR